MKGRRNGENLKKRGTEGARGGRRKEEKRWQSGGKERRKEGKKEKRKKGKKEKRKEEKKERRKRERRKVRRVEERGKKGSKNVVRM